MNAGSSRISLVQLLLPLTAAGAIWSFAAFQAAPSEAVETAYLAMLTCAILLPAAALARSPAVGLSIGTVLVTLAVWAIPGGPTRGATVSLLLLLTLIATAWRWISAQGLSAHEDRISWSFAVPAALGVQYLSRADQFLALQLDAKSIVGLLALPLAAAAALVLLAATTSNRRALLAGAAVVVLAPGWSVTSTLSLLAIALASSQRQSVLPRPLLWAASVAVVGAAWFWQPSLAVLLALGMVAMVGAHSWKAVALVVPGAALLLALGPQVRSWPETVSGLCLVLLILPFVLASEKSQVPSVVAAATLGLVALHTVAGPEALAVTLSIFAVAIPSTGTPSRIQRIWSALLVAGTLLLSSYPWLRHEPLTDLLGLFGLQVSWVPSLVLVTVAAVLALLASQLARLSHPLPTAQTYAPESADLTSVGHPQRTDSTPAVSSVGQFPSNGVHISRHLRPLATAWGEKGGLGRRFKGAPRFAEGLTLAALFVATVFALPPVAVHPTGSEVVLLDAKKPRLAVPLPKGTMVAEVVIDSYLSFAATLPTGTPVAVVVVMPHDGPRQTWRLRSGIETGEWAARRPDVAAIPGFEAPSPWISWVAPSGDLFAQRYRSVLRLSEPVEAQRVLIRLAADVPPQLSLALFHVELRP